jgi:glycosyltransferase involved in cell wall biosynthesis
MSDQKRVLVCANPDLNYIDGSSIWSQTIALILAETGTAKIDFLTRSTPFREELFAPLVRHSNINIISGPQTGKLAKFRRNRLSLEDMAALAVELDAEKNYDVILVRGYGIARTLLDSPRVLAKSWLYLTDISQSATSYNETDRETLRRIAHGSARVLSQTTGFRELWLKLIPDLPSHKCVLYSPVIPDFEEIQSPISSRKRLAVYAGKFTPEWMTLEMAQTWPELQHLQATLRMIGDKIHTNAFGFEPRMINALKNTPGLEWVGAMSRENVQSELREARVGLSWRAETLNDTLEFSTKLLEYGGAGCAAILNRNPLHESLLGEDYPLYANTREQYLHALEAALTNDDLAQTAANQLTKIAKEHTFNSRVRQVREWLNETPTNRTRQPHIERKLTVLLAGHDLKFFKPLQRKLDSTGKFRFLVDQWHGHQKHDEKLSRELLVEADVILCEWCLGNLVWYSKNRLPHQRLIGRFHAQERKLPYVASSDWSRIDHITYVSEHMRREGMRAFGFPEDKTSVIANYLDPDKFFGMKKNGDAKYNLGMIGAAPASKRPDRAVDLLERLVDVDPRYCLRIKGRHPLDFDWLLNRPDELSYYRRLFERINSNKHLSTRVIFDPPGDDINDWLSLVGYILSPSDNESFHMAIGEGLLSGCRPIIWPWAGAREIWGNKFIVADVEEAVEAVQIWAPELNELPTHMLPDNVVKEWCYLLQGQTI